MARRKPRAASPPTVVHMDQPCKNGQPYVAADGSCLRCGTDQGVSCPTELRAAPELVAHADNQRPTVWEPAQPFAMNPLPETGISIGGRDDL